MQRRDYLKNVGITAGVLSVAGCTGGGGGDGGDGGGSSLGQNEIGMYTEGSDYYFDPIGLFVEPGTTVTWVNKTGSHSATAYEKGTGPATVTRIPSGADAFNSGIISKANGTYEHTFQTEGTYDYFCIPHKSLGMVARIVVGSPGGPAEGSMPPDGKVPKSSTIVSQGSVSYTSFKG
ncbi:MAG: plastocyanin/azurin family copper-binding protein [Halodesulfurarchaeum sp.]